jgi:hypothetical protein
MTSNWREKRTKKSNTVLPWKLISLQLLYDPSLQIGGIECDMTAETQKEMRRHPILFQQIPILAACVCLDQENTPLFVCMLQCPVTMVW